MILLDKQLPKDIAEYVTKDEAIEIIAKLELELQRSPILGIGLAAPQIGINKAVAIIRVKNPFDPTNNPTCINLVNPKLVEVNDVVQYNEGCLSFPGKSARTIRYNEICIETADDYGFYAEYINAKRYKREPKILPLFTDERRIIQCGEASTEQQIRDMEQLICVCVQHEFSHLLGLTMFDFSPQEVGRNETCPCGSQSKNKKCHNYKYYNKNLEKLFNPQYRGA